MGWLNGFMKFMIRLKVVAMADFYKDHPPFKDWVVWDLDGTLCEVGHRVHHAQAGEWEEFHKNCINDPPVQELVDLFKSMHEVGYHSVVLTGRTDNHRIRTNEWLINQGIWPEAILMRPEFDYSSDVELKPRLLEDYFGSKEEVLARVRLVFDDRGKVVQALRDYGLKVMQVKEGDY